MSENNPDSPPTPHAATSPSPPTEKKIPKAVIKRLSLYSRVLQNLEIMDREKVSSRELAARLGLNSAQVRKDLAYFGQFGVPGLGYYVSDLRQNIKRILGTDRAIRLALVGVGNLGTALLSYAGFARQGFHIAVAFDCDRRKIGSTKGNVRIYDAADLARIVRQEEIDIGILAVPADHAQAVCESLIGAGINAILNFVPAHLSVPDSVHVHYVDLSIEIESLSYYLR
ncbi:redox-sensing transcriptional repressor Rex [Candidatus Sumerlaeota bacterium]|nr:redox-sensing transcriptional repressor Rex [Candidatus Sumerlaeota bacterium]